MSQIALKWPRKRPTLAGSNGSPYKNMRSEWPTQSRLLLLCLVLVLAVLLLDLFYVADTVERPVISQTSLSVLVLLALATTLTVATRTQHEATQSLQGREDLHTASQHFARSLLHQSLLECGPSRPAVHSPDLQYRLEPLVPSQIDATSQFLERKGLNPNVRMWVNELRKWFSKDLLPLILSSHIENCRRLNSLLQRLTSQIGESWVYEGAFGLPMVQLTYEEEHHGRRVSLNDIRDLMASLRFDYQTDAQVIDSFSLRGDKEPSAAHYRVQLMDSVHQRQLLETYFKVPGFDCRDYAITRLHELSQTAALCGYSNKAGGSFRGAAWSPRLPTDAKLLANVFFRMLSAGNNLTNDPRFNMLAEIYREFPEAVSSQPDLYFYQRNPPSNSESHYDVIVEGETWPCWPGADNLFCAVAVFLQTLRAKHKGRYRSMNCADLVRLLA